MLHQTVITAESTTELGGGALCSPGKASGSLSLSRF